MKTFLSFVALVALTLAAPSISLAQDAEDAEVTKMAKEHYKLGLDAYKNGKYDVAIKELKKAYLLKRIPALLLNIGATYRKMGDFDLALHFYKKYLDEAPPDARDRNDVEKTIADIKIEKEGGAKEPEPKDEPPPRREDAPPPRKQDMPREWSHNVVDAAPPDSPMDVAVSMPVMKGVKVFAYYRVAGQEDFKPVLMKRKGTQKVGRIPAEAMQGKALQYYIEARDPAGTVVNASGSQSSPNIVMIDPSAKPVVVASMERDRGDEPEVRDTAPDEEPARGKRRNLDDESAPVTGEVSDDDKPRKHRATGPKKGGMPTLMIAGIALLAGGAAVAIGGGAAFYSLAKDRANSISLNSAGTYTDGMGMTQKIFFNNDPGVTKQDASLESEGKLFDTLGGVMIGVGAAVAVTGAVLLGVGASQQGASDRPKKRKKRRVVVDEEAWYIAPTVAPTYAGASAGFSF